MPEKQRILFSLFLKSLLKNVSKEGPQKSSNPFKAAAIKKLVDAIIKNDYNP